MSIKKIVRALRPLQQVNVWIAGHDHLAEDPLTPAAEAILDALTSNLSDVPSVARVGRRSTNSSASSVVTSPLHLGVQPIWAATELVGVALPGHGLDHLASPAVAGTSVSKIRGQAPRSRHCPVGARTL